MTVSEKLGQISLTGCRILVIEDEYFLAEDICTALKELGADIIGPAGDLADATRILDSGQAIDAAVLDINLKNESIFPVADGLRARSIPFLFTSGYERTAIASRFKDVPLCEKPIDMAAMARSLDRLIGQAGLNLVR